MTITERDELGRIVKKKITSEEARKIGDIGRQVQKGNSKDQLLVEAGHEPDEAPEHLKVLANLAQRSAPAMKDFLRLTRPAVEVQGEITVQPGEACPVCKQYVIVDLQMSDETIGSVIESIENNRRNGE